MAALEAGRSAASRYAWREAYDSLSAAAEGSILGPNDLDAFADAAWWMGQMRACIDARQRAFTGFLEAGDERHAMKMAAYLSAHHRDTDEGTIAQGWLRRGLALAKKHPDTIEAGTVYLQASVHAGNIGDIDEAKRLADEALRLGTAHGSRDLMAFGLAFGGVTRVMSGDVDEGFAMLDEATLAAVANELGPLATGLVYCVMIHACSQVSDYERAGEYSEAARRWCERQSIAGFPGICRVHHAEVLKLRGAFGDAAELALTATAELRNFNVSFTAEAFHELGEIRLRAGDDAGAAEAFAQAYELGADPVPGRALLQVRQGNAAAGLGSIRRSLEMRMPGTPPRAKLLPFAVEIAFAAGDVDAARAWADELAQAATMFTSPAMRASAAHVAGELALADGDAGAARTELARAMKLWREVDLPYEGARSGSMLGAAYHALGDVEAARLEWGAARSVFERLGAIPDAEGVAGRLLALDRRAETRRDVKTFMFTDIVSSTDLLEVIGDTMWTSLIAWHDRSLRTCFEEHQGEEIKHTGDGFFVAFDTPVDAVLCAVHIQRRLAEHRREHGFAPQVRIGLHVAEASRTSDDDYRGMGVHESARIGAIGGADEIVASAESLEACDLPVEVSEPREVRLKGVAEPVRVVNVLWQNA